MTAAIPEPAGQAPADELIITKNTDGTIRVENAPLPERINVAASLWEEAYVDPAAGDEYGPIWLETIAHAGHVDADGNHMPVDNDGYMLHIDASNVACSYRFSYPPSDERSTVTGVLASWGEK